jgi:hypothetical protein
MEDDDCNNFVDNYNNVDDNDEDMDNKDDDDGEHVAVDSVNNLMVAIQWRQSDNNAGMRMAATGHPWAYTTPSRQQSIYVKSYGRRRHKRGTIWGGRDDRASWCACRKCKVWVRKSNKGTGEDGGWRMVGQPALPSSRETTSLSVVLSMALQNTMMKAT